VVACSALAVVAASCSSSGGDTGELAQPASFAGALRLLPPEIFEGEDGRDAYLLDLARLEESIDGVERDDRIDDEWLAMFLTAEREHGLRAPGTIWTYGTASVREVIENWRAGGIDPEDWSILVEAGAPPRMSGIAFGDFDIEEIVTELAGCAAARSSPR
jgi:hypothetical protein